MAPGGHFKTYSLNFFLYGKLCYFIRVKAGIARATEKHTYKGGRPSKKGKVDIAELKELYAKTNSFRKTADLYNATRYGHNRISRTYVRRVIKGEYAKRSSA